MRVGEGRQSIEPGNDQRISRLQGFHEFGEFGPIGLRAGDLFFEDFLDASSVQVSSCAVRSWSWVETRA